MFERLFRSRDAMSQAAKSGNIELITQLLQNGASQREKDTALHSAIEAGHFLVVKLLIKNKASVSSRDKQRGTPLKKAIDINSLEIVKYLVENGASVRESWPFFDEFSYNTYCCPVRLAVRKGSLEILQCLVVHGASLFKTDLHHNTLLILAAKRWKEDTRIVSYLIQKRLSLEAKNDRGMTALMEATQCGNVETMRCLLDAGASTEAKNKSGDTALDIAYNYQGDRQDVLNLLGERDPAWLYTYDLLPMETFVSADKKTSHSLSLVLPKPAVQTSPPVSSFPNSIAKIASDLEPSIPLLQPLPFPSQLTIISPEEKPNYSPIFFNNSSPQKIEKSNKPKFKTVFNSKLNTNGQVIINIQIEPSEFSLGEEIGDGGYAKIYKGTWHRRKVAIKKIKNKNPSPAAIEEFQREATLMKQANSPLVVNLYGITLESPYYLVMELMKGGSLYQKLHSGTAFTWKERVRTALEIAQGLEVLHQHGILHRDLKSMNILLGEKGHIKLCDFGLAQLKNEFLQRQSGSDTAAGTLAWMAPELFSDCRKYTEASDIYSLGMVLWELVSARLPFSGVSNPSLIPMLVQQGEREDIPSSAPDWYQSLIKQCWHGDAERRPFLAVIINQLAIEYQQLKQHATDQQQIVLNSNSMISEDKNENGLLFQSATVPSGEYLPIPPSM